MVVKELIDMLKSFPQNIKVCVGTDILADVDLTVLDEETQISINEYLSEPYLSIW